MCGIFGYLQVNPVIQNRDELQLRLDQATDSLRHRGPDGRGTWISNDLKVCLGHRRLAILDLSERAQQPMLGRKDSEKNPSVLTYNGEIYNFKDLKSDFEGFQTNSDTAVLLEGLETFGTAYLSQLDGMFAFGFYHHKKLLLAVDPAGKKPLYTYWDGRQFAFASEIKAFSAFSGLELQVDEKSLKQYLIHGYVPGTKTIYKNIQKLAAGHYQIVDSETGPEAASCYWDLPLGKANPHKNTLDAERELHGLLASAVQKRLVADVPLACFLSGGLDSSVIAYEAARCLHPQPLKTFSIGFKAFGAKYDESQFAELMAKKINSQHTCFQVHEHIDPAIMSHFDEPFADSSALPTSMLCQETAKKVKVALSGDGGDELFGGYRRFQAALACERGASLLQIALAPIHFRHPAPRSYADYINRFKQGFHLPMLQRLVRWNSYFTEIEFTKFFQEDLSDYLDQVQFYEQKLKGLEPGEKILHFNFKTYLYGDLLPKVDRMSMRYGLEVRSPFLDKKLIEYAFCLPTSLKFNLMQTKIILKKLYRPILGAEITDRKKQGFAYPIEKVNDNFNFLNKFLKTIHQDTSLTRSQNFMLASADLNLEKGISL